MECAYFFCENYLHLHKSLVLEIHRLKVEHLRRIRLEAAEYFTQIPRIEM